MVKRVNPENKAMDAANVPVERSLNPKLLFKWREMIVTYYNYRKALINHEENCRLFAHIAQNRKEAGMLPRTVEKELQAASQAKQKADARLDEMQKKAEKTLAHINEMNKEQAKQLKTAEWKKHQFMKTAKEIDWSRLTVAALKSLLEEKALLSGDLFKCRTKAPLIAALHAHKAAGEPVFCDMRMQDKIVSSTEVPGWPKPEIRESWPTWSSAPSSRSPP